MSHTGKALAATDPHFYIDIRASTNAESWNPCNFVYDYHGNITCFTAESDDEHDAGAWRASLINGNAAAEHGWPIFEVADEHSQTLAEIIVDLFDLESMRDSRTAWIKEPVEKSLGKIYHSLNLLYVEFIALKPAYRGHDGGLKVLRHLIDQFGMGTGLCIIKPYPLQLDCQEVRESNYPPELALEQLDADPKRSTTALIGHYKRLGFRPIPNSPFFAFNMADSIHRLQAR